MTDHAHIVQVDIAVRAYPVDSPPSRGPRRAQEVGSGIVVAVDAETRVDLTQRLLFGSYRVYEPNGRLVEEGLIAADDLTDFERKVLEEYVDAH